MEGFKIPRAKGSTWPRHGTSKADSTFFAVVDAGALAARLLWSVDGQRKPWLGRLGPTVCGSCKRALGVIASAPHIRVLLEGWKSTIDCPALTAASMLHDRRHLIGRRQGSCPKTAASYPLPRPACHVESRDSNGEAAVPPQPAAGCLQPAETLGRLWAANTSTQQ